MKGTKALSFLLVFALLASLVVPGFFALPANAEGTDNGMRISKTATKNQDGSYTITLEAYATGSKVISEVKTDVPADIVLVLDQSGSMDDPMNTYAFRPYTDKTNSDYYDLRHNGGRNNLYYQLDDGGYASVSVVSSELSSEERYAKCSDWTNYQYYHYQGTLYSKEGDTYHTVRVDASLGIPVEYTYTFHDGRQITSKRPYNTPDFKDKGPLYYLDTVVNYSYTYSYTDQDGVLHDIGTSAGNDATPEFTLHERYSTGSSSRLVALKSAVTTFANTVAAKAAGPDNTLGTDDDVDHRVAVVGYASRADSNNPWINTELFIGSTQHNYNVDASSYYSSAFQDMSTAAGQSNVLASIGVLDANGATYTNYGLEMANGIFNSYPLAENQKRSRIIILFTDGYPGKNADDFNQAAANTALTQATTAKNAGITVYSVGIFDGADATSPGNKDGTNTQAANWFMQQVSSNNGTPRSPSYYLSAADAGTLSTIFQQIANKIEEGGSSTKLDAQSVIKDIISPQFTLPAGATANDITLETYKYTGENQWTKNSDAMGATATVNDDQVSVTGFNFSDNWCGTVDNNGTKTYRGNMLKISFNVQVKDGFLGGNGVYTNTSAGVYQNSSATDPVKYFDRPQVDIAINDVTVGAQDKNVYLLQNVPVSSLTNGTTIQVGNVSLDLTKPNYGLESWQNEYVDISVVVKDKDGQEISDNLSGLTNDSTYTVSVTVSPKTTGNATEKSNNDTAKINVFKPVLTYRDSEVYYGASVPTDFTYNLVSTSWVHGTTLSDINTMGAAPALAPQYTPVTGVVNGTIATKQDIPVDVTVNLGNTDITQYVTFYHNNCSGKTCDVPTGSEFLLHVKTCTLTITKSGGDGSEPYVFDVYKDGAKYSEVSIAGDSTATIVELPVGSYTIQEDTGWSWRYSGDNGSAAVLSAVNPSGSITCTNTKTQKYWLNGFSEVVANIFDATKASN